MDFPETDGLEEYAGFAHLAEAVARLRSEAAAAAPRFRGRHLWMLNSTAQGGGVAELLPKTVQVLRELGILADWAVLTTPRAEFWELTKRMHNLIHDVPLAPLTAADRTLYEEVSREAFRAIAPMLRSRDILIVHDPQPCATGAFLKEKLPICALWQCHIGLDRPSDRGAWEFLRPYAEAYHHVIFSLPEYVPGFLQGRATAVPPGIDPESSKNCDLSVSRVLGILTSAGLVDPPHPTVTGPWPHLALRVQKDGRLGSALQPSEIGLGFRPTILQVSRWDRLKGWRPLLQAFAKLKPRHPDARLVLAGPQSGSVQDDPESTGALDELVADYRRLGLFDDVAILALPMASRTDNALLVNALQRCATIVAQNSLEEGFGLTVTEAMWKRAAVLGSGRAAGLRFQIRDGIDGRLAPDPEDPASIAAILDEMLRDPKKRDAWGRSAQRRVHDEFLFFTNLRRWLSILASCLT